MRIIYRSRPSHYLSSVIIKLISVYSFYTIISINCGTNTLISFFAEIAGMDLDYDFFACIYGTNHMLFIDIFYIKKR
jgi:hypothetical protein